MLDIRKIKKLIDLLESSQLTEIEIREGEESIRLSRGGTALAAVPPAQHAAPVVAAPAPVETAVPGDEGLPSGNAVTSPMVGTFYAAARPESEPFVQVGSRVSVGDTLCIIEAMKIFNQIEADRAGTIKAVLKQTGDPVEYGETLFIVE